MLFVVLARGVQTQTWTATEVIAAAGASKDDCLQSEGLCGGRRKPWAAAVIVAMVCKLSEFCVHRDLAFVFRLS